MCMLYFLNYILLLVSNWNQVGFSCSIRRNSHFLGLHQPTCMPTELANQDPFVIDGSPLLLIFLNTILHHQHTVAHYLTHLQVDH